MTAFRVVLVCEGNTDAHTARRLVSALLCREHPWLVESHFEFTGIQPGERYLAWSTVPRLADAQKRPPRFHGQFAGRGGDFIAGRKALWLISNEGIEPALVVLFRDTDSFIARLQDLKAARETHRSLSVAVGAPHCKIEAWWLAGLPSLQPAQKEKLRAARQRLGFDPCEKSERLDARQHGATRCAKRAVKEVIGSANFFDVFDVEDLDLERLESNGTGNHFIEFRNDLLTVWSSSRL